MAVLGKRTFLVGLAVLLCHGSGFAQQQATPAVVTVIRAGTLIDPRLNEPKHDQLIIIRGDRIESVDDVASRQVPTNATVIDLSNSTVLPGLIESHAHIVDTGEFPDAGLYDEQLLKFPLAYRVVRATVAIRIALGQGITTIRDVHTEGAGYSDIGIKRAVEEGYIPGPRIVACTRGISSTGAYGLYGFAPEIEVPKGVQVIDGPVEARKATREQLDHGADCIKAFVTNDRVRFDPKGNLFSPTSLTLEELKAIVEEAHGWHRKVACHAYMGDGVHRALDAGCDSIEHGVGLDDSAIAQMKAQGTFLVPTLLLFRIDWGRPGVPIEQAAASLHEQSFKKAMAAGIKIAFGTDVGSFDWGGSTMEAEELGYYVKFGMSPINAIRTATLNAAELLDMPGKIGVIAPGAYADIIAVRGNPLLDITELQRVKFVMKNGSVFKKELE